MSGSDTQTIMQSEAVDRKRWMYTGDYRNDSEHCRNHASMDGQTVPKDIPFTLTGLDGKTYYPMYPRDPSLPEEERVGCVCAMQPVVSDDVLGMSLEERQELQRQAIEEDDRQGSRADRCRGMADRKQGRNDGREAIKEQLRAALDITMKRLIEGLKTPNEREALGTVENLSEMSDAEFDALVKERCAGFDEFELSEVERVVAKRMFSPDCCLPLSCREAILLDVQAMARSRRARERHAENIAAANLYDILYGPDDSDDSVYDALTEAEARFLRYIDGKPVDLRYLPGYFTYQDNLDFAKTLKKLFFGGHLYFAHIDYILSKQPSSDLKAFLKEKGFPCGGSKGDLIARILGNFSIDECKERFSAEYFEAI